MRRFIVFIALLTLGIGQGTTAYASSEATQLNAEEYLSRAERASNCAENESGLSIHGEYSVRVLSGAKSKTWVHLPRIEDIPTNWTPDQSTVGAIFLSAIEKKWTLERLAKVKVVLIYDPTPDPGYPEKPKLEAQLFTMNGENIALKEGRYLVPLPELSFSSYLPIRDHESGKIYFLVTGKSGTDICKQEMRILEAPDD